MDAIQATQSRLDDKLAAFQDQVCQSQEEAASKAVKKSKAAEKPFIFKKKGNEAQAKFNAQVEDAVEEAIGELDGISHHQSQLRERKQYWKKVESC